jgi:hypothetical protein
MAIASRHLTSSYSFTQCIQGPNSYVNTQLVNATILLQPEKLLCANFNGTNATFPDTSTGPGLNVTSLPEPNTTLSGFPTLSDSVNSSFPPELAGESIAVSTYNTTSNNVTLEVTVETLEVTNGEGFALIGLTGINGTPQRFSSGVARGSKYEYLDGGFIETQV